MGSQQAGVRQGKKTITEIYDVQTSIKILQCKHKLANFPIYGSYKFTKKFFNEISFCM